MICPSLLLKRKKVQLISILCFFFQLAATNTQAQMRAIYQDVPNNDISKISFYSPANGYVAFTNWIGYTTDSGRTYTNKYISNNNVNANGYPVEPLSGFSINGTKAFNKDTVLVYGYNGLHDYILQSIDQANTFKVVYFGQGPSIYFFGGIKDMIFPQNSNIGYAVDADRILKTVDKGGTWVAVANYTGAYFDFIEGSDDNNIYAVSTGKRGNFIPKVLKSANAGVSFTQITLPTTGNVDAAHFLTGNKGWLSMHDNHQLYYTSNGGSSWSPQNNINAEVFFYGNKIKFINDSTGFALDGVNINGTYQVVKTTDTGKIWEQLPRDNTYSYLGYSHNDLQIYNTQLWAGGGVGFLEMNTNFNGPTLPKAYFKIDTTNLSATNTVNLVNASKQNFQYKWYKNNVLIGTTYNMSYTHAVNQVTDTIKLVVINSIGTDTLIKYQYFNVPAPPIPTITSFTPVFGQMGSIITITGANLGGATSVKFGGTPATSYTVVSTTSITAVLGTGASGNVTVTTPYGTASLGGFQSLVSPITSFSPASGGTNAVITITGANFYQNSPIFKVRFGGVLASSINITSPTTLNAVVASGASGDVTLETSYGLTAVPGFTYIGLPKITSFTPTSADQGMAVTISGQNFMGTTDVKFGGTSASGFTIVTPNTIVATVGAGSSGVVKVMTPRGNDSLPGFTYTSPTIISFSPQVAGTGTIVTITGNNFTGASAVSFGGTAATSFTVNSPTSITAVVASGTSGSVTIVTPHGTISKSGFIYTTIPIVQSFAPIAGPIGTLVTITGANFNSTANANIVYFGASRAVVTGATANSLTAIVPAGASYDPISVTTNNLTANSAIAFTTTFAGENLTINSFETKKDYGTVSPSNITAYGDFDLDGKPDLAVKRNDTVALFRNISTTGNISLAAKVDFLVPNSPFSGQSLLVGDMDGDGKLDIIALTTTGVGILKNTSSSQGSISFAPVLNFTAGSGDARRAALGDIDGDGKLDVALVNLNNILILKNTTVNGIISFASATTVPFTGTSVSPYAITINDLDADGKADIAVSNYYQQFPAFPGTAVMIFKNTSSINAISFATNINFGGPGIYSDIKSADINADGNPDLIYSNTAFYNGSSNSLFAGATVGILKNQNVPGTIALAPVINDTCCTSYPDKIAIGSLNGDAKPDLALFDIVSNQNVLQNTSNSPGITFSRFSFNDPAVTTATTIIVDLDGDGRGDLVRTNRYTSSISIFRNRAGEIDTVTVCENSNSTQTSSITGTNYQWQQDSGSGFTNLSNNTTVSGVQTATITFTNIPIAWNGYKYRCLVDGSFSKTFLLKVMPGGVAPAVTISTPNSSICNGIAALFTAVPFNGGNAPSYQWQVNGINTGNNSNSFTSSTLNNNDQVKTILTSSLSCALPNTVQSNVITMTVAITPVANAGNDITICAGSNIQLNGSGGTTYLWSPAAGLSNPNIANPTASPAATTAYILTVFNSVNCFSKDTVVVTVNQPQSPSVTISTASNNICAGSTVTFTSAATNGGTNPLYQWQVNGINVGTINNLFTTTTLNNNDQVKVILTSNAACATPPSATSNLITMTVQPQLTTPLVSLSNKVFTVTNPDNSVSYTWQINSNNVWTNVVPLATGITYTAPAAGEYRVMAVKGPCTNYSIPQVTSLTGGLTANNPFGIYLYPNPGNDIVKVDSIKLSQNWETLEVINTDGKQVLPSLNIKNQTSVLLSVSTLIKGTYFIQLRKKDGEFTTLKFIKI